MEGMMNRPVQEGKGKREDISFRERMEEVMNWRLQYVSNSLDWGILEEEERNNRYTKRRWGPPIYLDDVWKEAWENRMREARGECRRQILIPWLHRRSKEKREEMFRTRVDGIKRIELIMEASEAIAKRWSRKMNAKSWGGLLECARFQEWLTPAEPIGYGRERQGEEVQATSIISKSRQENTIGNRRWTVGEVMKGRMGRRNWGGREEEEGEGSRLIEKHPQEGGRRKRITWEGKCEIARSMAREERQKRGSGKEAEKGRVEEDRKIEGGRGGQKINEGEWRVEKRDINQGYGQKGKSWEGWSCRDKEKTGKKERGGYRVYEGGWRETEGGWREMEGEVSERREGEGGEDKKEERERGRRRESEVSQGSGKIEKDRKAGEDGNREEVRGDGGKLNREEEEEERRVVEGEVDRIESGGMGGKEKGNEKKEARGDGGELDRKEEEEDRRDEEGEVDGTESRDMGGREKGNERKEEGGDGGKLGREEEAEDSRDEEGEVDRIGSRDMGRIKGNEKKEAGGDEDKVEEGGGEGRIEADTSRRRGEVEVERSKRDERKKVGEVDRKDSWDKREIEGENRKGRKGKDEGGKKDKIKVGSGRGGYIAVERDKKDSRGSVKEGRERSRYEEGSWDEMSQRARVKRKKEDVWKGGGEFWKGRRENKVMVWRAKDREEGRMEENEIGNVRRIEGEEEEQAHYKNRCEKKGSIDSEESWYIDLTDEYERELEKREKNDREREESKRESGDGGYEGRRDKDRSSYIGISKKEEGTLRKLKKKRERIWKRYSKIGNKIKAYRGGKGEEGGKGGDSIIRTKEDVVLDMTTTGLREIEKEVLQKGKSFVFVEERVDKDRLQADIAAVMRRIRLKYLFGGEGIIEEENGGDERRRGQEEIEGEGGMEGRKSKELGGEKCGAETNSMATGMGVGGSGVEKRITVISRRGSRDEIGGEVTRGIERWEGRVSRGEVDNGRKQTRLSKEGGRREKKEVGLIEEEWKEYWRRKEVSRQRMEGRFKSSFAPSMENKEIDELERLLETEIAGQVKKGKKRRDNLTREERKAVGGLKRKIRDKEIIITQADKGGGLVAIDYKDYVSKGDSYIREEAGAYELVNEKEEEVVRRLGKERDKIADQLRAVGIIDVKTATFIKHQARQRITGLKFFLKIHKSLDRKKVPVRPLQSCIHSPMQNLAIILNDILMPFIEEGCIQTYIRDSNSMLHILRDMRLEEGEVMYTADVSALYPSIPHDVGMAVMEEFLEEFRVVEGKAQREKFIEALRLVITHNYMKWEGQIFRQSSGVAMGTPVAVAYANIFMNHVDRLLKGRCSYIREFRRYIDDNWFILPRQKEEEFKETLNSLGIESIKYTVERLEEGGKLAFLDISMEVREGGKIGTRLYTKPTDKHPYLLPTSFHPPAVSKGIPFSVFSRIRRLCSEEEWFWEDSNKAIEWMERRGYKRRELEKIRLKVGGLERWKLIEEIEKRWNERKIGKKEEDLEGTCYIPFVTMYNTKLAGLKGIVKKYNKKLEGIFKKQKLAMRMVFRRPRNLADVIIQPGLRIPIEGEREVGIFKKCGLKLHRIACACGGDHDRTSCRMCMHVEEKVDFCQQQFSRVVTCDSRDVIYVIWCGVCGKRYIGETRQPVRERVKQHLANIRLGKEELYEHFRYHKAENLKVAVLEALDNDDLMYRKVKEARWIRELSTIRPRGLNTQGRESPLDILGDE